MIDVSRNTMLVQLVLLVLYSCYLPLGELSRDELFRIKLYPGSDLVLEANSNPCTELTQYCASLNITTILPQCVQRYQQKVQGEILVFSGFMRHLDVDERLFMSCRERVPVDKEGDYGEFYTEMLQILRNASSGDVNALQLFDMRRNEMRLNQNEAIDLYRKALVLHPNSTYIISRFGLLLWSYGYKDLAESLWANAVGRGLWPNVLQRPEWYYVPHVVSKPWHDPKDFTFVHVLEAGYLTIRNELLNNLQTNRQNILSEDIMNRNIVEDNQWRVVRLKDEDSNGYTNCSKYFPETVKILEDCGANFILAKFSAILPGTHIKPHTGPSNDRLRVHLGLVHTGGARLRVGTEWRSWREGEVFIFDSSWEHEVYHDGPDLRIVMILDIWNSKPAS